MTDPQLFRSLAYVGIAIFGLLPLILSLVAIRHLRNIARSLAYLELSERCRNANGRTRE